MESSEYAIRMQAATELLLGENMDKQRLNADDVQRLLRWNREVGNPSPAVTATYGTLVGLQAVVGQPGEQRLEGMQEYPQEYKELAGVLAEQVRQLTDEQRRAQTFAKKVEQSRPDATQSAAKDGQDDAGSQRLPPGVRTRC